MSQRWPRKQRCPSVSYRVSSRKQTGTTPGRFVERVRVEAARDLLESNALSVDDVATHCGFGSAETMRRAFLRVVGVGPSQYRERFTAADLVQLPGVS